MNFTEHLLKSFCLNISSIQFFWMGSVMLYIQFNLLLFYSFAEQFISF